MVNRRRSPTRSIPKSVIVFAVLIAGCGLTYGIVRAAGWLEPTAPLAQEPSREGLMPVPKSLVNLRAFEVVQREDVYDLSLGDDSYFWLPKSQVEGNAQWLTRVDQIVGRVMARDKRAEFVFSEKDFLPEGSRSGIAGGIAVGKQGFFLDADKVPGLRFLKSGDRFDLLASHPDDSSEANSEFGLLMGGIKARGGKPVPLTGVRILVQNAEMVALTTNRNMTTQGGLQLENTDRSIRDTKGERVAISIDPAEAVPLTQALGEDLEIHMVTRSGQETESLERTNLLAGRIAIPANAREIEAFQPIRASDLAEPTSGELRQYFFKPDDIQDSWITQPERLIGRVVRRNIEPGYLFSDEDFLPPGSLIQDVNAYEQISPEQVVEGFRSAWVGRVASRDLMAGIEPSESDFFPPGTKPGLTAAIPSDRMALTIDSSDVRGVAELLRGDRCDLLASSTLDLKRAMQGVELSPALASELQSKAVNRVLATDAVVVQKSPEQVVLAARPSEISLVAKALAQDTPVFCVVRTNSSANRQSQPPFPALESTGDSPEPTGVLVSDPNPLNEIEITETLIGGRRTVRAYRRTP